MFGEEKWKYQEKWSKDLVDKGKALLSTAPNL